MDLKDFYGVNIMNIKVLIAKGFEETEAIVLIDLLRRAGYNLKTVSITDDNIVEGGHGIKIITDSTLNKENFDEADMLLLPGGGGGVANLSANDKVLTLVKKFYHANKYIAAICAAPIVLDKAGILKGKTITCYPSEEKNINDAKVIHDKVVVDGKLITSRGVGTAIDMGLKIIEVVSSKKASNDLKEKIVY
jgi:4-methyl-5(b-hydroxyethyl)-thiazole monophosphate biosynthesis